MSEGINPNLTQEPPESEEEILKNREVFMGQEPSFDAPEDMDEPKPIDQGIDNYPGTGLGAKITDLWRGHKRPDGRVDEYEKWLADNYGITKDKLDVLLENRELTAEDMVAELEKLNENLKSPGKAGVYAEVYNKSWTSSDGKHCNIVVRGHMDCRISFTLWDGSKRYHIGEKPKEEVEE